MEFRQTYDHTAADIVRSAERYQPRLMTGMTPRERHKRVYRVLEQFAVVCAVSFSVAVIGVIGFVYFLTPDSVSWPTTFSERLWDDWFFAIFSGLALACTYRGATVGVYPRGEDVRVRNFFRTHTIPWAQVDRFAFGVEHLTPFKASATLWTTGGKEITIWSIQAPNQLTRSKNHDAQDLVDELNEVLAEARAHGNHLQQN